MDTKKPFKITDRVFILTDLCMWEKNKKDRTKSPHAIQVIDLQTGATRYIQSGSRIRFVAGQISKVNDQNDYNLESK
jgi:hypothetical protein